MDTDCRKKSGLLWLIKYKKESKFHKNHSKHTDLMENFSLFVPFVFTYPGVNYKDYSPCAWLACDRWAINRPHCQMMRRWLKFKSYSTGISSSWVKACGLLNIGLSPLSNLLEWYRKADPWSSSLLLLLLTLNPKKKFSPNILLYPLSPLWKSKTTTRIQNPKLE